MDDYNQDLLMAIYVNTRRTYDVLLRMLIIMDEDAGTEMAQQHDEGKFFSPEPNWPVIDE